MNGTDQTRSVCLLAFCLLVLPTLVAAAFFAAPRSAHADDSPPPAASAPAVPAAPVTTQPAPQPAPPPARGLFPAQPPPPGADSDKPGFFHQFGKWWDDSVADFNTKMKDAKDKFEDLNKKQSEAAKDAAAKTQEAMKNAAQATKDAASAVVRLSNSHVIELKERCPLAANGAPDCQTTATNACHAKGFTAGQPADVRSSQQCPASILLSGRTPAPGECPTENVLMRAVCQ